jgi:hypothetical protein
MLSVDRLPNLTNYAECNLFRKQCNKRHADVIGTEHYCKYRMCNIEHVREFGVCWSMNEEGEKGGGGGAVEETA